MKSLQSKQLFIEIMAALFVLLFLYTAIMKLKEMPQFISSMSHTTLIRPYIKLIAVLIPVSEIVVSILLVIPATRVYGLIMATGLMSIFTIYVGYIVIGFDKFPCSCGGVIEELGWRGHLLLNSSFLLGGILSLRYYKNIVAINRRSRIPAI